MEEAFDMNEWLQEKEVPKPAQKAPEPERKVEKNTATTAVATKSTQTAAAESKPAEVLSILCYKIVGMTIRANSSYPWNNADLLR